MGRDFRLYAQSWCFLRGTDRRSTRTSKRLLEAPTQPSLNPATSEISSLQNANDLPLFPKIRLEWGTTVLPVWGQKEKGRSGASSRTLVVASDDGVADLIK